MLCLFSDSKKAMIRFVRFVDLFCHVLIHCALSFFRFKESISIRFVRFDSIFLYIPEQPLLRPRPGQALLDPKETFLNRSARSTQTHAFIMVKFSLVRSQHEYSTAYASSVTRLPSSKCKTDCFIPMVTKSNVPDVNPGRPIAASAVELVFAS